MKKRSSLFYDYFDLRQGIEQVELFISAREQAVVSRRDDLTYLRFFQV
jgi:hypothetical protein